jgi:hypothetical protein
MKNYDLLKEKAVFLHISEILLNYGSPDFENVIFCLTPQEVINDFFYAKNDENKTLFVYLDSLYEKTKSLSLDKNDNFMRFTIVSISYFNTILYYFFHVSNDGNDYGYKNLIKLAIRSYINVLTIALNSIGLHNRFFLLFFDKFNEFKNFLQEYLKETFLEFTKNLESYEIYHVAKLTATDLKKQNAILTQDVIKTDEFPYQFNINYERNLREEKINPFSLSNKKILRNNINYVFSENHVFLFIFSAESYFKLLNNGYLTKNIILTNKKRMIVFICLLNTIFKIHKKYKDSSYDTTIGEVETDQKPKITKKQLFTGALKIICEVELLFPPENNNVVSYKRRFVFLTRIKVFNFFLQANVPPKFFIGDFNEQKNRLLKQYCSYYLKEKTKVNKELLHNEDFWLNFPIFFIKEMSLNFLV